MKWLLPAAVVVIAVLAEVTLGRLGHAPDFALFFGRFHPLVVHLPIGFFILVSMGEAATLHPKLRDRVEPALGLLVPVAAVAALGAFLMGQLLALEGGFPAGALGWHRRLTLLAIIGMAACWVLFDRGNEVGSQVGAAPKVDARRWAFRGVMGITLGVLSLGAHFGGTMTRGESYLSQYAPGPLKPLLGAPEPKKEAVKAPEKAAAPVADPLVYQDVLQPLLTHYCVACHGPEKQKGKLRLDTLEALMKGGENGPVVLAGNVAKSPLVARVLLPTTDDDHMPPAGKPSPKPEELALLQFWIERGASPTLKVRDALAPTVSRSLLEHALGDTPPSDSVPVSAPGSGPADSAAAPATAASAAAAASPTAATAPATHAAPNGAATSGAASNGSAPNGAAASPSSAAAAPATLDSNVTARAAAGATSGPGFLAAHCEKCHGAQKQKGKLRVDSLAALLKGGANGSALVPGKPDQSALVQRVRLALTEDEHMPPSKEPQPTASEISSLVAWIRSGVGGGAAQPALAAKTSPSVAAPATPTSTPTSAQKPTDAASPADAAALADTTPAAKTSPSDATPAADTALPDAALLQSLPPTVVLFADAVQPLFREKCGKCHIRDKPAGGLNVDQQASILEGGFSGPGVVAKDRQASFVMQRLVKPPADDDHMPPEGEPVLSADEVELIGSWIDQGAPASGATETAKLSAGAARALSARGVKASSQPQPLAAQAGGCAACSVPGAPQSKWLGLQALALFGAAAVLAARRRHRQAA